MLHTAWRSTGDTGLLERHLTTAERCLEWIEQIWGSRRRRFPGIRNPLPRLREPELEGFGRRRRLPGWFAGEGAQGAVRASGLCLRCLAAHGPGLRRAGKFQPRAGTTDKRHRPRCSTTSTKHSGMRSSGSMPTPWMARKNRCSALHRIPDIVCGRTVPADRARRVVERLMKPDMWSGWGIRTLSANHPAYNPHSYQNGSVWPHDNGIIATGFRRYGFATEASRIARDSSEAAKYFILHQVSELYAGIYRNPTNFPVQYLGANVPQAWAAGSVFAFLTTSGFQPDAPNKRLFVDPVLPERLPNPRVLRSSSWSEKFDLRFWRDGEQTGGKCSREIRPPSSLAAAPAGVSCRSKPAVASTARFQICHATPHLLCQ